MSRKIRYVLLALSVVLMVTYSSDSSSLASQDAAGRPSFQSLQLRGLRDRVTVRRDERGIPYIEATKYWARTRHTECLGLRASLMKR